MGSSEKDLKQLVYILKTEKGDLLFQADINMAEVVESRKDWFPSKTGDLNDFF